MIKKKKNEKKLGGGVGCVGVCVCGGGGVASFAAVFLPAMTNLWAVFCCTL